MTVQATDSAGGELAKPADGVSVTIDGFQIMVPKGTLVIRAAEMLGIQIPRFCDHPLLVADGSRGYLFDPRDPSGIAAAISKLAALDAGARRNFERNAREYASAYLSVDKMVESYAALFQSLIAGRKRLG